MSLPDKLPAGTAYHSTFYGGVVLSQHEGKLTYQWGAKGHCGMDAQAVYSIPILGGHVCEYATPELIPILIMDHVSQS